MIEIRPAKIKDAPAIAKLNLQMMRHHRAYGKIFEIRKDAEKIALKWFQKAPRSPKNRLFVAETDKQIVGYLWADIRKRPPIYQIIEWGSISDVCVDEKYRRQGVAAKLIAAAFKWFKEKKLSYVDLFVASDNEAAQFLWKKYAFKEYFKKMYRKI